MSVQGMNLSPMQRIQWAAITYLNRPTANSTAAIIIWLTGALATKTFLGELGVIDTFARGIGIVVGVLCAIVLQAVLTLLEGPIWHSHLRVKRSRVILGFGALVVDTSLNVGGVWYFLQNLGNTTFWNAIASATNTQAGPSPVTILLLAVLFASAVSAAPEALWDL